MKKQQNNSTRAWALHVALSIALLSISAVLVASSFNATPATSRSRASIKPVAAGGKDLAIAGPASSQSFSPANAPFTFTNTGSLGTARSNHTATLLPSGKVLVAGGVDSSFNEIASAELYDPVTGSWSNTGPLGTARDSHTATLLPNGKVLVAGGVDGSFNEIASAELYDPASGTWTATGSLGTARTRHTATLLSNGEVLVAGGSRADFGNIFASAELYNPASGTWTTTGSLNTASHAHTATLLPDGKVLVAGGFNFNFPFFLSRAELYDPAVGTWSDTGSLNTAREFHTATLLPNGKVLVAGGLGDTGFSGILSSAELYDPSSGTWSGTGSLTTAREFQTATLLPNGKVLVAGGAIDFDRNSSASAELYDPASESWTATGSLNTARYSNTTTLLPNGRVLVAGGFNGSDSGGNILSGAELYDPATTGLWTATGSLGTGRDRHSATLLPYGKVLVAAGGGSGGAFLSSADLYDPATGLGRLPAASAPHATLTRRRCCPQARCWWREESIALVSLEQRGTLRSCDGTLDTDRQP